MTRTATVFRGASRGPGTRRGGGREARRPGRARARAKNVNRFLENEYREEEEAGKTQISLDVHCMSLDYHHRKRSASASCASTKLERLCPRVTSVRTVAKSSYARTMVVPMTGHLSGVNSQPRPT